MMGRAGYDVDIDRLMAFETHEVEEMRHILERITDELKEMRHLEKNLKGLDDFLKWTLETKKWFEKNYDVKMFKSEEHPDEKKALKHTKYKKMARLTGKTYRKIEKVLETFAELEHHKKRFELLNQKLKQMVEALLPELRKEYREERVEAKA